MKKVFKKTPYVDCSDEDYQDLKFLFSPDAPLKEQIANYIFRFTEYKNSLEFMMKCLNEISYAHYKVFNHETLEHLKKPIQLLLFTRESLEQILNGLKKDIEVCDQFLIKLEDEKKFNEKLQRYSEQNH